MSTTHSACFNDPTFVSQGTLAQIMKKGNLIRGIRSCFLFAIVRPDSNVAPPKHARRGPGIISATCRHLQEGGGAVGGALRLAARLVANVSGVALCATTRSQVYPVMETVTVALVWPLPHYLLPLIWYAEGD